MLHVPGRTTRAALEGGVALQRVWLRATHLGLALQPISAGLYMLQQLDRENSSLAPWERAQLASLRDRFMQHFPLPAEHTGILVFRLFYAEAPSARSARLPLTAVFSRARR